jgi:hypothetical protein
MGSIQFGDSGSPLIGKFGEAYKIIGIAKSSKIDDCVNADYELVPNKPFQDNWAPVSAFAAWIRETLDEIRSDF